ncbi:MAG: Helix-turn-helix domain [Firmicutes bacterium]|nr:Helix-turn-helix domain [Bacillota bacterium]
MRDELLAARKFAGKTQADVASASGIDRSYYAHIEKGHRSPSLQVAIRIASFLQKDIGEIFLPNSVTKSHIKRKVV